MKKNGLERNLVIFLFLLVLVVFSFAQRDSKKIEKLYYTAQLLQQGSNSLLAQLEEGTADMLDN